MIYIPKLKNTNCVLVYSNGTIRVYDNTPTQYNVNYTYTEYYTNNHYMYNTGVASFSQYSTLPTCRNRNELTSNYMYRTDFSDICIIFFVLGIFIWYLPFKIYRRLFRRFN